jgi:hypothetical protein
MHIPQARAATTMASRPWMVIRLRLLPVSMVCSCCKVSRARRPAANRVGRACFPHGSIAQTIARNAGASQDLPLAFD